MLFGISGVASEVVNLVKASMYKLFTPSATILINVRKHTGLSEQSI